jgi:lysophospholipase L1-like esterase
MTARNGSSFRKGRLIGCCIAAVLLVSALFASTASAAKTPLTPTSYVALGDSLAFGYTALKFAENSPEENPSAFENGYTNVLAKKLAHVEKTEGNALSLVNLGCPGELSDGLIGHNPALGGYTYVPKEGETGAEKARNEAKQAESNPCPYHNQAGHPLHFESSASQLETAYGYEAANAASTKLITLNIGSNDELKIVGMCANKAYDEANGFSGGLFECITVEAGPEGHYHKGGLFHHILANMGDVVGVLRAAGYKGQIAILGFYNPQSFILPGSDSLQKKLNEVAECTIESKAKTCTVEPKAGEKVQIPGEEKFGPGVVYANPFPKINPQKAKAEKKNIEKFTEECNPAVQNFQTGADPGCEGDIHPTPLGYKVLANVIWKALGH